MQSSYFEGLQAVRGFIGFHPVQKVVIRQLLGCWFDNLNDYYDPLRKEARLKSYYTSIIVSLLFMLPWIEMPINKVFTLDYPITKR